MLKETGLAAENTGMLLLLLLVTIGYFAGVLWLRHRKRQASSAPAAAVPNPALHADDLPPHAAVGWPPAGARLTTYLDEGQAAIDAFLIEKHRP